MGNPPGVEIQPVMPPNPFLDLLVGWPMGESHPLLQLPAPAIEHRFAFQNQSVLSGRPYIRCAEFEDKFGGASVQKRRIALLQFVQ
jgi:hypothetical protein